MADNNQLFTNIKNAREQINRLRQEADILNNSKVQQQAAIRDYMGSVVYSLNKADQNVEKTYNQYKTKLPSLSVRKEQGSFPAVLAYKKYKKTFKVNPTKQNRETQSTKLDISANNISFSIQNRPLKFHSHHQKHMKAEYSREYSALDKQMLQISIPEISVPSRKSTGQPAMRKRFENSESKSIKYINLNNSTLIKRRVESPTQSNERRIYQNAVDIHSKHIFMIINGILAGQGPEYASYKRIYQSVFPQIKLNVTKLQEILKQHNIRFVRLDGKRLAYVSLKDNAKMIQLIQCLQEADQIKLKLFPRTRFQGRDGAIEAANLISSYWKMHKLRKHFLNLKAKTIFLQYFFKKKHLQLQLEKQIRYRNASIIQKFTQRQQKLSKVWQNMKHNKRIQIHLNSIEVDEEKRVTIENYNEKQNIQLSRIFRLKDENLIIIYLSPNQLSLELINYYYRMLQLGGVPKYRDRLIFMSPHSAEKFPNHFSVSKLVYYSSATLKQLKIVTSGIPTIVIPGYPSNELVKICDYLDCYLFGGQPQRMKQLGTKSQVRRFCSNLMLQILPGAMEMYDYGEFMNTFAVLLLKNPQIQTWLLKIDDEFGGRGIAYFEVVKCRYIQSLFKKIAYDQNVEFFATDIASDPYNQEITIQIRDYLKEHLAQRLRIATPTLYKTYTHFMGRFIKKGGVIEAAPPCLRQNLKYPSISFCLQPQGQCSIISTYERIMGQPYRTIGCSFPQQSIDFEEANRVVRELCSSFKLRKLFGFFTIDFVVYQKDNVKKSWVVDIDPYLNNYTSSIFMFDTLMQGSFFAEKNLYLVETHEEIKSESRSVDTTESLSQKNLSSRRYVFVPHFHNPNILKVKIKTFFKQARMQRFNFDIGNREGLCILLLDQLTSGVMGLLSVAENSQTCDEGLRAILQFIGRISSVKNVSYGKSENIAATDAIGIKDVISVFSSLSRREQKKNAKEKAMKKYQLRCNLQLII